MVRITTDAGWKKEMAKDNKSPMTYEERNVYTKAFRASDGKKMRGKSGDAETAVKTYRAKKKK